MSDMSNYLENALINATLRNTAYTSPTTVYIALYTAVTDAEAGTGTEVSTSGTAYARTAVTFAAPSNGVASPSSAVTFPTATASWGTVTHFAVVDNATAGAGNVLYGIKALTASKAVASGDTLSFSTANLSVTLA